MPAPPKSCCPPTTQCLAPLDPLVVPETGLAQLGLRCELAGGLDHRLHHSATFSEPFVLQNVSSRHEASNHLLLREATMTICAIETGTAAFSLSLRLRPRRPRALEPPSSTRLNCRTHARLISWQALS